MLGGFEDCINDIIGCKIIDDLHPLLDELGQRHGFAYSTYADVRHVPLRGEPLPFFLTSIPAEFTARYVEMNMASFDPIVRRAATSNAPFLWTDVRPFDQWSQRRPGVKSSARKLMDLATDFRFFQGYAIPCHAVDAAGRPASALVSFYWLGPPQDLAKPGALPVWLRLAVLVFHERMLALRGCATNDNGGAPELSDREVECLGWSARGKTIAEVATILGLAPRTVEFHLANAMRKLGVFSKVHAVAVAIQLGLISP